MLSKARLFTARNWERFSPYLLGLIATAVLIGLILYGKVAINKEVIQNAYPLVMTFSSIMAAFLASLFGVMFAVKESKLMEKFRKTSQFSLVKEYMFSAIIVNLVVTLICFYGNLIPIESLMIHMVMISVISCLFIISVLFLFTLTKILKNFI